MRFSAHDGRPVPGAGERSGCAHPAHARELLDRLEAKVGILDLERHASLAADYAWAVPGASEPPD
ncbi:hypothetical protein [Nocardioides sp. 503]|uniref:hypothetical protein n=1 Tax=Nocardioides sp. 503 TaxID=2508326 RepID=UPI00106F7D98|nr:hypothetical protein [Nocardioides sp. 503]